MNQPAQAELHAWLQETRWRLDVLSDDLLPGLLDQPPVLQALRQLATRGKHSRIRLLSRNTEWTARNGHGMIPLIQRLPSILPCRLTDPDQCTEPAWVLLADRNRGLLSSDGVNARPLSTAELSLYQSRFDHCWDHAAPDPYLRRISL